ncbi:uncharacterized protein LOC110944990 [Helianthus annuus]|uniref:uncharacterized protein LOC110944990 n=1 Tax=Helianthus annuus TaxID=4232 RepID=UPI000B8FAF56|nr:uncharacterized protein LOC110944990 [Helianthus annuus]
MHGDVNKALMISHIWSILVKRDSLWVDWVHSYRLKGHSFWTCKAVATTCCSWRKLLQLRPLIRNFIWSKLGNGSNTSAWFDWWSHLDPLGNFLTPRTISNAGFSIKSTVQEICDNGSWRWPEAWRDSYPVLIQLDNLQLESSRSDKLLWNDGNDLADYSSSRAWHSIRERAEEVDWTKLVWFTQWGMNTVSPEWDPIVSWLAARASSKSVNNFISRLIVAASIYFVWQERNARIFKNQTRPPDVLSDIIVQTVRYKLMGVKFKESSNVRRLLESWGIYSTRMEDDGG